MPARVMRKRSQDRSAARRRSTGTARASSIIVAFALACNACGSEPEFAETPVPDAGAQPTPPPTATAPPPAPDGGAPAPAVVAGPCDPNQSLALTTMLSGRAAAEAPGATPEGPPTCGVVGEGQSATGPTLTLQQNVCYTVLAHALPPVTEVDVLIEADVAAAGVPPAFQAAIPKLLAQDADSGEKAAIGAKGTCYKNPWPFPLMVKLVAKARTGSGPVAAQLYKKK